MKKDHPSRGRRRTGGPVVGQTGARFGGAAGRRCRDADQPPEEDGAAETNEESAEATQERTNQESRDWPVLGQAGARFLPSQQQAVPPPEITPPAPEAARAASTSRCDAISPGDPVEEASWDVPKESYGLVRPYFWTGGRTTSRVDLAVETLVSATGREAEPATRPEHRAILGLCATPRSVAELAALLKMPLGVARVLLGDLAAAGSVAVHRTAGSADAPPDVALMQRVLAGLQRL